MPHARQAPRAAPWRAGLGELVTALTRIAVFVLWYLVLGAFLLMPPLVGTAWVAVVGALFVWRYAVRAPSRRALIEHATLRLRPIRAGIGWLLAGAPVTLLFAGSVGVVWLYFVEPTGTGSSASDTLDAYMRQPLGWLPSSLLIVLVGPVIEEFVFRGWIQRPLERRWGAVIAITATAALFALMHFEPLGMPVRLLLGVALGFAVYATRSIWAGVLLHAINNAFALAGGLMPVSTPITRQVTTTSDLLFAVPMLVLTGVLLVWIGRKLWEATRGGEQGSSTL